MSNIATIYIVDDDEAFRKAIVRLLHAAGYNVKSYASATEFLKDTMHGVFEQPACLLLDLCMPGPDGLELQAALAKYAIQLPTIFLSGFGDVPTAVRAIKAGAVDFLPKPVQTSQLLEAIRLALTHQAKTHSAHEQVVLWKSRYDRLSPREMEIFHQVIAGKMNKEIAVEMDVCERTIKAHRASVMEKMHAKTLAQLVQMAVYLGIAHAFEEHVDTA